MFEEEQKLKNLVYSRWINEVETPARQQLMDRCAQARCGSIYYGQNYYGQGHYGQDYYGQDNYGQGHHEHGHDESSRGGKTLEKKGANEFDPLISIVMPTYNTDPGHLHESIQSVLKQCYSNWQLSIVDDASDHPWVSKIIQRYAAQDARISVTLLAKNQGIAEATNRGIEVCRGEYIGFLDHDDVMALHALEVMAAFCREHPHAQLIYSNSDDLDASGQRSTPFFKPAWNYDLFLGQNYLNHFTLYKAEQIKKVQGLRNGFHGSQDYDLALRVIEGLPEQAIAHVPDILYHWRVLESSVSRSNLKKATENSRRALQAHLDRTGQQGTASAATDAVIYNRVKWLIDTRITQIAVLVFGRHAAQIERVVAVVKQLNPTQNYIALPVLLESNRGELDVAKNLNKRVARLDAEMICFLSEDYVPCDWGSLEALLAQAERPLVGAASGKLVTGCDDSPGYFAHLVLDQQVDAIHGACFATQKKVFDAVGGVNELHGKEARSLASLGRSYSQKIKEQGLISIWSAQAKVKRAVFETGAGVAANDSVAHWPEPIQIGEVQR